MKSIAYWTSSTLHKSNIQKYDNFETSKLKEDYLSKKKKKESISYESTHSEYVILLTKKK